MKNRKKQNDKRRRREKRIEPVQSSNIEFEHLIPVKNISNLSFEKGKKQSFQKEVKNVNYISKYWFRDNIYKAGIIVWLMFRSL